MLFLQIVTCLLASVTIVGLIYYKFSLPLLQQMVAFLVLAIVLALNRFFIFKSLTFKNPLFQLLILFLISVFVQLLVIATGSLYSPLLILVHLLALSISFFFSFKTGLSFTIFALTSLGFALRFNPQLWTLFQNDPGPAVLYFLSFFIIIPLSQFLAHNYHFKGALLQTLKEYSKVSAKREESILLGLKELVIVADEKLQILSVNEAAQSFLKKSDSEVIHLSLLDIFPLKNEAGNPVTPQMLSLDQILEDKATRIVNNLFLGNQVPPEQVVVQVRPVTDSSGQVNQLVFLITPALIFENSEHSDLIKPHTKYQTQLDNLIQSLLKSNLNHEAAQAEMISKAGEDLICAMELEDHPLKLTASGQDVAQTCQQVVLKRQTLAKLLRVNLEFSLPAEDISEASMLNLNATTLPKQFLPISRYTVHTDHHWLGVLLQGLIDIAVLLSTDKQGAKVLVKPLLISDHLIKLMIFFPYNPVGEKGKDQLLSKSYGDLEQSTGLRLGSGLEGFIAQTISQKMGLTINLTADQDKHNLVFSLELDTHLAS